MTSSSRYMVVHKPVDFRKGHDGLYAEARALNLNPLKGDVVIFVSRNKRRIKVLWADRTGMWVGTKKFLEGAVKTQFQFLKDPTAKETTPAELAMLLEGIAYEITKRPKLSSFRAA